MTGRGLIACTGGAMLLGAIAWASPAPNRLTDRPLYEAAAERGIIPDCSDIHCFRVLVPWSLGLFPGESAVKWKAYAVLANTAAAVGVFLFSVRLGLTSHAAVMAAALSLLGFGSLYTLHDSFTADPLMFAVAPLVALLAVELRFVAAAVLASVGVLAKEFAAAPLYVFTLVSLLERRRDVAARALAAANAALITWLVLQLTLMLRFNYSYADNPSTQLMSGGYLAVWFANQTPASAASAIVNEFGVLWLLAPIGMIIAPPHLRHWAWAALPVAMLFAYVQQPDRALWNFHFLVTPLAAVILDRTHRGLAWGTIALFAVANLRVGAQLPFVPAARGVMAASLLLAAVGVIWAWKARQLRPAPAPREALV